MQVLTVFAVFFYLLSSAAYLAYLFIQRNGIQIAGCVLLAAGFVCQSVELTVRFAATGHLPVTNLSETLFAVAWTLSGVFLLLRLKFHLKILGVYAAPLSSFVLITALQFPAAPVQAPNLLKGFWLVVHVLTILLGDAAFALAAGAGLLYLLQERSIKNKTPGFFFKRLPSLELLDSTGYACIVTGFTLLTVGLITGMVFAKNVWGRFWSWDPKEVWSAITWIFYAVLLHERLAVGWRGRRAAIMSIVGLCVMLFTFFGVNFLLKGHHGQFTRF